MDLARDRFIVSYDESVITTADMFAAIEMLGFEPTLSVSEIAAAPQSPPEKLPEEVLSLLANGKPMTIYFGATWCGACKVMERTTFKDESVLAMLKKSSFLKVDVEESEELSHALSVRGVPTVVILDRDGAELYRYIGPLNPTEMKLVLEQYSGG